MASCREHRELCEGEGCAAVVSAAGAAGRPSGEDEPPFVAGMAAEAPECARDRQCWNASACDGVEVCVDGRCEPGEPVACQRGARCEDDQEPLCVYQTPAPWLITTTTGRVRGLPAVQLSDAPELLTLAERPQVGVLSGFERVFWAPDGKVALVRAYEDRWGSSMSVIRFGAGLPSALIPLPDLPDWGDYSEEPLFSADSKWALVTDSYTDTYLVDLALEPEPPRIQPREDFAAPRQLCAEPGTWLPWGTTAGDVLATLVDGEVVTRPLGTGSITVSPDAKLLLVVIEDEDQDQIGIQLTPCSAEAWAVELPGADRATFSPDSSSLLVELSGGGLQLLSLADERSPTEVWSNLDASTASERSFSPNSERLVFRLNDAAEAAPSLHVLQLSEASPFRERSLELPPEAALAAVGNEALLVWSSGEEPSELLWRSLVPAEAQGQLDAPLVLVEDSEGNVITEHRLDAGAAYVSRSFKMEDEDLTVVSRLRFDRAKPDLTELGTFAGALGVLEAAPSGLGVALLMTKGIVDNQLFWVGFSQADSPSEPRLLADQAFSVSFQPWP